MDQRQQRFLQIVLLCGLKMFESMILEKVKGQIGLQAFLKMLNRIFYFLQSCNHRLNR